ncbi:MAG: hypothetical protein ABID64_04940 [Nitrospirota bacterium]
MLILSSYIDKHELKPLQKYFSIDDLSRGAQKVLRGLGQKITPLKEKGEYHFFKVRIGNGVKGRMIVFVVSKSRKVVPLLIRLKKDKKMGMNMSANNPHVVSQIEKNLEHVIEDIEQGKFKEFGL